MKARPLILIVIYISQLVNSHSWATTHSRTLEKLLEQAQAHYFSGSPLDQTQAAFEKLIERIDLLSSDEVIQELYYFALLRRAQLAIDDDEKKMWMHRAIVFDWQKSPDASLFAPEFIKDYQEKSNNLKFQSINCGELSLHSSIFLNGRPFKCQTKQIKVPRSDFLIWASSAPAKNARFASMVPLQFRKQMKPNQEPAMQATSPQVSLEQLHPSVSQDDEAITPVATIQVRSRETPLLDEKPAQGSIFKNKWLWIGVGVLTTGIVLSQSQRRSPGTQPSSREGL